MAGPRGLMQAPIRYGNGNLPYRRFRTTLNERPKMWTLHRVICETFHGPAPFDGAQARHLDGDSLNNMATNLAWGSACENANDRSLHGRIARGERCGSSRLNSEQVRELRRRHSAGEAARSIARSFNVSDAAVRAVLTGKSWGWLQ